MSAVISQVCCLSGEPLNEHNEPVALPNGMVYGVNSLRALATPDGRVTCPRTGQTYALSETKRLYVM